MCTLYLFCCSVIELPATDGSIVERLVSHTVSEKLTYFGPEMPLSSISGIRGNKAESIVVSPHYDYHTKYTQKSNILSVFNMFVVVIRFWC